MRKFNQAQMNKYRTVVIEIQIDNFLNNRKAYKELSHYEKGYIDYMNKLESLFTWMNKTDAFAEISKDFGHYCKSGKYTCEIYRGYDKAIRDFIAAAYKER